MRPVALQNAELQMLPAVVARDNPWNVPRRVNGIFSLPSIEPSAVESEANA